MLIWNGFSQHQWETPFSHQGEFSSTRNQWHIYSLLYIILSSRILNTTCSREAAHTRCRLWQHWSQTFCGLHLSKGGDSGNQCARSIVLAQVAQVSQKTIAALIPWSLEIFLWPIAVICKPLDLGTRCWQLIKRLNSMASFVFLNGDNDM